MAQFQNIRRFEDQLGEVQAGLDRVDLALAQLRALHGGGPGTDTAVSQISNISDKRYFVGMHILLWSLTTSALVMLILILL